MVHFEFLDELMHLLDTGDAAHLQTKAMASRSMAVGAYVLHVAEEGEQLMFVHDDAFDGLRLAVVRESSRNDRQTMLSIVELTFS
jgi:hypothetical protein